MAGTIFSSMYATIRFWGTNLQLNQWLLFLSLKVYCTRCNVKSRQKTASNQICLPRTAHVNKLVAHLCVILTCAFITNCGMLRTCESQQHVKALTTALLTCSMLSRISDTSRQSAANYKALFENQLISWLSLSRLINYTIKVMSQCNFFCCLFVFWILWTSIFCDFNYINLIKMAFNFSLEIYNELRNLQYLNQICLSFIYYFKYVSIATLPSSLFMK